MKVAIVHDWLVTYAGAERVLRREQHRVGARRRDVAPSLADAVRDRLVGLGLPNALLEVAVGAEEAG